MTFRTLIRRSLRYHWRSHLGVVIGAAIGSAALIGALTVGDSVKGSLRETALSKLRYVRCALSSHDRLITEEITTRMPHEGVYWHDSNAYRRFYGSSCVSVLQLPAVAATLRGSARANSVNIIGVAAQGASTAEGVTGFWQLSGKDRSIKPGEVLLNQALASQLQVQSGDTVVLRVNETSGLSADSPISPTSSTGTGMRLRVEAVLGEEDFGNFSISPSKSISFNAFVNLEELQKAVGKPERVNTLISVGIFRDKGKNSRWLEDRLEELKLDRAALLFGLNDGRYVTSSETVNVLQNDLVNAWRLEDAECALQEDKRGFAHLTSSRVFLDLPIERAALTADTNAQPILTYIANLITSGTNATPYSMVTAAGAPWTPSELAYDEIVLNQWLADDLQAQPGDEVAMVYFDPESGARLSEHTNTFRVHSVVPMELPWADRTLMPEFPGIDKAESTADWDTAFPLTYKIRDKDDDYWQQFRGTPKAFITLAAGKQMWANRFGEVTAIRFPVPTASESVLTPALSPGERENRQPVKRATEASHSQSDSPLTTEAVQVSALPGEEVQGEGERSESFRAALERNILSNLDPAELGLRFEPVREQALKAAKGAQDFGGLFIGFSLFLIAAALILMALLFQFGLEQRAAEVGTLLALGFTHKQVRRLLLGEGAALAFIGGVIGVAGGAFYAKAMLLGLRTVWRDAVGGTTLDFFVTPTSLLIGLFASTFVAVLTLWLALRKQARRPAITLLSSKAGDVADGRSEMGDRGRACQSADDGVGSLRRIIRVFTNAATAGVGSLAAAAALVGWALAAGETSNAGAFFGAGALVLIGGLTMTSARLRRSAGVSLARKSKTLSPGKRDQAGGCATFTAASLAFRGLARRRSRSVATVALLASGSFLILSIGVFRLDANRDATERSSGTGGFALIGEATIPVVQDLNSTSGREFFALDEQDLEGAGFVQFRVKAGDDASCLNLNRAQKPRLLGVNPNAMAERFTFAKVAKGLEATDGWQLLKPEMGDGKWEMDEVPAIGDLNSILWAMGKKVGDTLDYVDDRGRPFKVRIAGAVANSVLQGNLIIDESEFVKRFPGGSGYQYFLMDAPTNRVTDVSATLSRAMQDYGLEVTPAARRLNQFNAVQNTYLGTFQIIGGLGLLLGSAGLGIVVLRNVLERRGELAVLMAVGLRKRMIERLVLMEHAALLGLGLAIGLSAAAVAVLPALLSPGSQLPYATLVPTLLVVLANGLIWTWAATRMAIRGNLLEALRNE